MAIKSLSLSSEEVASIPLAAITAIQALRLHYEDHSGRTVFVSARCSMPFNMFFYSLVKLLITPQRAGRVCLRSREVRFVYLGDLANNDRSN